MHNQHATLVRERKSRQPEAASSHEKANDHCADPGGKPTSSAAKGADQVPGVEAGQQSGLTLAMEGRLSEVIPR